MQYYKDQNGRTLTLHPHWSGERMWAGHLAVVWYLIEERAGLLALVVPDSASVWEEALVWREHQLYSEDKTQQTQHFQKDNIINELIIW